MKGVAVEELLYFVAIFFSVFFLFVFLTYQMGTKGAEVRKSVEERLLSEGVAGVIHNLFNNRFTIAEKTYVEIGIDAVLQGKWAGGELDKVVYGCGIGYVNVTEIINSFFDEYVKGRWELIIITPDAEYKYGRVKKEEVVYTYEVLVPVPEERVGRVIFSLRK